MREFTGYLKQDMYRAICNRGYLVKVVLIAFIYLISQADLLRMWYASLPMKGYDVIGVYNWVVHYDRFHILLLMVAASVYTSSYCVDARSEVLRYLLARGSLKMYIVSKYTALSLSTAFAYIGGTTLYLFILSRILPFVEEEPFITASSYMSFEAFPVRGKPLWWIGLTILLATTFIIALCSVGFYISFYWTDSLVAICSSAILYFALIELTLYLPKIFFVQGYMNHVWIFGSNMWINYTYKLAVNSVCVVIFAVLSYKKLRSGHEKGTI